MNHNLTPIFTELLAYSKIKNPTFDVPGHKRGNYKNELYNFLGENTLLIDTNSTPNLDLLSDPIGVIKQSQDLMADAFQADKSYYLVNGSSAGVQAMILSALKPNEKIIMPRNVHKSVISGLILSGAIPIFIQPDIDNEFGITNGISLAEIKKCVAKNNDIKAIFLINPTYFGIISELAEIIRFAKKNKIAVLVDQAHGAHFPFYKATKKYNAASLGADLVCVSMHKTAGSLTQSSVLLHNENLISEKVVQKNVNMLQSTSASYLLMASLEVARKDLIINGQEIFSNLAKMVENAKSKIANITGLQVINNEYCNQPGRQALDPFKITIKVNDLGVSGFEFYNFLKEKYKLQMELAETYTMLAIISVGDTKESIDFLIQTLSKAAKDILEKQKPKFELKQLSNLNPKLAMSPRDAYYANKIEIPLEEAKGRISTNSLMIYPPGIPLLIPGEIIEQEIIEHYKFYESTAAFTISEDEKNKIEVIGG